MKCLLSLINSRSHHFLTHQLSMGLLSRPSLSALIVQALKSPSKSFCQWLSSLNKKASGILFLWVFLTTRPSCLLVKSFRSAHLKLKIFSSWTLALIFFSLMQKAENRGGRGQRISWSAQRLIQVQTDQEKQKRVDSIRMLNEESYIPGWQSGLPMALCIFPQKRIQFKMSRSVKQSLQSIQEIPRKT